MSEVCDGCCGRPKRIYLWTEPLATLTYCQNCLLRRLISRAMGADGNLVIHRIDSPRRPDREREKKLLAARASIAGKTARFLSDKELVEDLRKEDDGR